MHCHYRCIHFDAREGRRLILFLCQDMFDLVILLPTFLNNLCPNMGGGAPYPSFHSHTPYDRHGASCGLLEPITPINSIYFYCCFVWFLFAAVGWSRWTNTKVSILFYYLKKTHVQLIFYNETGTPYFSLLSHSAQCWAL